MLDVAFAICALVAGGLFLWRIIGRDYATPIAYKIVELDTLLHGKEFRIEYQLPWPYGTRWHEYSLCGGEYPSTWWSDTREGAEQELARIKANGQTS